MKRVAVLISGRGSNLAALLEAARDDFPARIALVIANRDAAGLEHAARAAVATATIPHRDFATREDFERAVDARIRAAGCDLVCLAGFMRVLTPWFIGRWRDRLINIHPSLLPAFPGLDTHARALAAGVRVHGCTVHFVREGVDQGPIIAQAAVPVLHGDDADTLAARVLRAEHHAFPLALRLIASGAARVENERVIVAKGAKTSLFFDAGGPSPDGPSAL